MELTHFQKGWGTRTLLKHVEEHPQDITKAEWADLVKGQTYFTPYTCCKILSAVWTLYFLWVMVREATVQGKWSGIDYRQV